MDFHGFWRDGRPYLRMGLDPTADVFTSLFRVAIPTDVDPTAYNNYISDPSTYAGAVYRVSRSANNTKKNTLFGMPTLKSRVTSNTETSLQTELNYLTNQVKAYYSANTTSVQTYSTVGVPIDNGFQCINNWYPCFAETRDTPYIESNAFTFGSASTPSNDFIVVTGVQHETTGNAMYTDATLSSQARDLGIVSAIQKDMTNSVTKYLPQQLPSGYNRQEMIDKLYAVTFAWDCTKAPVNVGNCITVPSDTLVGVSPGEQIIISERAYLHPKLRVGVLPNEIDHPTALHFNP